MSNKILVPLILALGALLVALQPLPFFATQSKIMPSLQLLLAGPESGKVKVWVYFQDHGEHFSADLQRALQDVQLSERALRRRMNRSGAPLIDVTDLPVNRGYIDNLKSLGLKIRRQSKYLNAVSAEATPGQIHQASSLSFVKKIDRVLTLHRRPPAKPEKEIGIPFEQDEFSSRPDHSQELPTAAAVEYGPSLRQVEQINVLPLHDLDYHGEGVLIAMFDTGFNRSHEALDHLDIVAEWDFIYEDGITKNEPNDTSSTQHNHGTQTLATVGGYQPGQLVGPAWAASYILAKTERVYRENSIEEDDYVRALEWAEGLGADVVSSSIGYNDWYSPSDFDGNTAVTTIAADIAAGKGVTIVTAVGNEGSNGLIAPSDGDSVIAVGAVDNTGNIASFSSRGPTYDGRIKPDVMAMGKQVYTASPYDSLSYNRSDGTSFSTPLVAGVVALLLQMHPDWGPIDVWTALTREASKASDPNNDYGWGIVDAYSSAVNGPTGVLGTVQLIPVYEAGRIKISIRDPHGSGTVVTLQRQDYDTVVASGWSNYQTIQEDIYVDSTSSVVIEEILPPGVYRYRLHLSSDPAVASDLVEAKVPFDLRLGQSYPNPFVRGSSPEVKIPYIVGGNPNGPHEENTIEELAEVTLIIYDVTGARVRVLMDGLQTPGGYIARWNGLDDRSVQVASGVYYYRLAAGSQALTRKLVFLR
jgi:hypothetical protein